MEVSQCALLQKLDPGTIEGFCGQRKLLRVPGSTVAVSKSDLGKAGLADPGWRRQAVQVAVLVQPMAVPWQDRKVQHPLELPCLSDSSELNSFSW